MAKTIERVNQIIKQVQRRKLHNNTQKVLLSLLSAQGEWVSRTALRIPSATSRIRDLRTEQFGQFEIECASAADLNRGVGSFKTKNPTFYRLRPRSVRIGKITKVFEGALDSQA